MPICSESILSTKKESFLEGQIDGLDYFDGAPLKVIFDNAKVAVKEGFGVHAKIQARYADLSAHYAFKPEFCNIATGDEKRSRRRACRLD